MPDTIIKHNEWLKKVIPSEKLHFIDIKDGWKPLCDILDKPVPNESFPRANDAEAADAVFQGVVLKASILWLGIIIPPGSLLCGTWWFWTR